MPLLKVKDLFVGYQEKNKKNVPAVNGLSLDITAGTVVGLLGESGCGKTATAKSIVRLQEPAAITAGEIIYNGQNLLKLSSAAMSKLRGSEIAVVFQDASAALNPVFKIGRQITDIIKTHQKIPVGKQLLAKLADLLDKVELNHSVKEAYPHQLSGGMKQRAAIAMALAGNPKLIIADEPTTGLDAGIAKTILNLFQKIKKENNLTMLFITHDIGAASYLCDEIVLMYRGKAVETAPTDIFLKNPLHPYSIDLLNCLPRRHRNKSRINVFAYDSLENGAGLSGCAYYPRCQKRRDICRQKQPPKRQPAAGQWLYCWQEDLEDG